MVANINRNDYVRMQRAVDFLVYHIAYGRSVKAMLIAQFLRDQFGLVLVKDLDISSGHVKSGRNLLTL